MKVCYIEPVILATWCNWSMHMGQGLAHAQLNSDKGELEGG